MLVAWLLLARMIPSRTARFPTHLNTDIMYIAVRSHPDGGTLMTLANFHPLIRQWFAERFPAPTGAQRQGWPAIQSGKDTLIAAPTGSGKTLTAFLASIDRLLRLALAGESARSNLCRVCLAAAGPVERHPAESAGTAGRDFGPGPASAARLVRRFAPWCARATRRPRTAADGAPAAAHPGHHARIALPGAHRQEEPRDLAARRDGDRRRNSRRGPRQARVAPGPVAGAVGQLCARLRPVRIGLSATQKPLEELARFLVGSTRAGADGRGYRPFPRHGPRHRGARPWSCRPSARTSTGPRSTSGSCS